MTRDVHGSDFADAHVADAHVADAHVADAHVANVARADPLTEPREPASVRQRLLVVDKLRGLVIVLMVLDHTRHFFHAQAFLFSATDVGKTTPLLFATRWITHLCAPTFVFLAGASAYLQGARGRRGPPQLTRFLLTRGLWLIVLEMTVVSFGFGFYEPFVFLQVIWAIGFSFVLLAAFTRVPPSVVLALGLVIVGGHDLLDGLAAPAGEPWRLIWTLMLEPGRLGVVPGFVAYPALPWFGIMAAGYGLGGVFLEAPARRNRVLLGIGLVMLASFAVLRAINAYGDPSHWKPGVDTAHMIMSFFNVTKYPPSLMYVLATLGIVLTAAPVIERVAGPFGALLHTFGRTPLLIYLVHLYLLHGLALLTGVAMGLSPHLFADSFEQGAQLRAAGWGLGLGGVYAVWAAVVLALWPLSVWFAGVKERRRDWWLGYI